MAQTTIFDQQLAVFFRDLNPADSLLLTPNKRLSRFLSERYAFFRQQVRKPGEGTAFVSLQCLAYTGWVQQQWQQAVIAGHVDARLLSPVEELLLWEEVIEHHPETPALLNVPATARMARDAWRLQREWHLFDSNDGNAVFGFWSEGFQALCLARGLATASAAIHILTAMLEAGTLQVPTQVVLYGFDEHSPAVAGLLEAIGARSQIQTLTLAHSGGQSTRYHFQDTEQELLAVAHWALRRVKKDPQARLGIVVPDLSGQRAAVEHMFTQVFDQTYIYPEQMQHAPGYNLSAGQPLVKVPMVAIGIELLNWSGGTIEIDSVSRLLRSPFIGCAEELASRSQVDITLRKEGEFQIRFQTLKTVVAEWRDCDGECLCPQLYDQLQQFDQLRKQAFASNQFPSQWVVSWLERLAAMGWPGERTLDSLEYQQAQSWRETLEDFAVLDAVLGKISSSRALRTFTQLLQERSFQPQTRPSPVQILGVLESAGLPFDAIWMINLDDETWPPAPRPNPLLSLTQQVNYQLPHCSAERELLYAQRLLKRLHGSTPELICSYARAREDKQLRCSPLVMSLCTEAGEPDTLPETQPGIEQQLFSSQLIETSLDDCGPRVINPDAIRGGTQILKSQAACPFQAFARHRLHTTEIPPATIGLSPAERGNLVHNVMEILWRKLCDQKKLLAMTDKALLELIDSAIARALEGIKKKGFIGPRFLNLEASRLREMVCAWLELEKQRSPFHVIFNEGRKTVKLGKMPIHIRYDRVDKLENGSLLVLDYKTGKPQISDWTGERPNEPQVPLYAVANYKRVSGAAFGQISTEEVAFKGIAEDEDIAPGLSEPQLLFRMDLPEEWADILAHWQRVLERLAREFLAGSAVVDPKQPTVTCRYCELQSLCRIREGFDIDAEDDEGATADTDTVASEGGAR